MTQRLSLQFLTTALAPVALALSVSAGQPTHSAGACPVVEFDTGTESRLIEALQDAPDAGAARAINAKLWALWTNAPDAHAQDLLDSAMARIRMGDLSNAIKALDSLVDYCPGYAEGYNQRAFARYLDRDFTAALDDIDMALSFSPRHIGALSGKALTLIGLGQDQAALKVLEKALSLNPWLSEGALVDDLERRLGAQKL